MNSDNRRDIYLPKGTWTDFFTGEQFEGSTWLHLSDIPLERMPVYVRRGAQIPLYPESVDCTDEMDLQKTVLLSIDNDFKGYKL